MQTNTNQVVQIDSAGAWLDSSIQLYHMLTHLNFIFPLEYWNEYYRAVFQLSTMDFGLGNSCGELPCVLEYVWQHYGLYPLDAKSTSPLETILNTHTPKHMAIAGSWKAAECYGLKTRDTGRRKERLGE